jgi:type IV secretory pathway VirB4 component
MINWIKNIFKTKKVKRIISDEDFNLIKKEKQDKLNQILDKIVEHGYGNLSKNELEFLKKYNK